MSGSPIEVSVVGQEEQRQSGGAWVLPGHPTTPKPAKSPHSPHDLAHPALLPSLNCAAPLLKPLSGGLHADGRCTCGRGGWVGTQGEAGWGQRGGRGCMGVCAVCGGERGRPVGSASLRGGETVPEA